jgi:hypothetical protein
MAQGRRETLRTSRFLLAPPLPAAAKAERFFSSAIGTTEVVPFPVIHVFSGTGLSHRGDIFSLNCRRLGDTRLARGRAEFARAIVAFGERPGMSGSGVLTGRVGFCSPDPASELAGYYQVSLPGRG